MSSTYSEEWRLKDFGNEKQYAPLRNMYSLNITAEEQLDLLNASAVNSKAEVRYVSLLQATKYASLQKVLPLCLRGLTDPSFRAAYASLPALVKFFDLHTPDSMRKYDTGVSFTGPPELLERLLKDRISLIARSIHAIRPDLLSDEDLKSIVEANAVTTAEEQAITSTAIGNAFDLFHDADEQRFKEHANELTDEILTKLKKRYPTATILKVKAKRNTDIWASIVFPAANHSDYRYKITLKDKWNDEFDVSYSFSGKLRDEDSHKVPFDVMPEVVRKALNVWPADTKYDDFVDVKKKCWRACCVQDTSAYQRR